MKCGVVVITTVLLLSTESEGRFWFKSCSEVCDGENLLEWSWLNVRLNTILSVNISLLLLHQPNNPSLDYHWHEWKPLYENCNFTIRWHSTLNTKQFLYSYYNNCVIIEHILCKYRIWKVNISFCIQFKQHWFKQMPIEKPVHFECSQKKRTYLQILCKSYNHLVSSNKTS